VQSASSWIVVAAFDRLDPAAEASSDLERFMVDAFLLGLRAGNGMADAVAVIERARGAWGEWVPVAVIEPG
jgi:hypothetical protein